MVGQQRQHLHAVTLPLLSSPTRNRRRITASVAVGALAVLAVVALALGGWAGSRPQQQPVLLKSTDKVCTRGLSAAGLVCWYQCS